MVLAGALCIVPTALRDEINALVADYESKAKRTEKPTELVRRKGVYEVDMKLHVPRDAPKFHQALAKHRASTLAKRARASPEQGFRRRTK